MGIILKVFNIIIWTILNLVYSFIDAIYSSFVKLNGINIISDILVKDDKLVRAYNYIIVLSVVVLGFFAVWNYMKKFLDPDETPPVGTITLEVVKCTMLVVLSSFLLTQLFNFAIVLSGAMGNLFMSEDTSFSGSIVSGYVEVNPKFQEQYEAGTQTKEAKNFYNTKQQTINGYIKKIKSINSELNNYSSTTGIKYLFNESTYSCTTKTVKVTSNKKNTTNKSNGMLSAEDKNISTTTTLTLTDKISSRNTLCSDLKKEVSKEYEGKSSKFPITPDKDPFAGMNVKNTSEMQQYISNSFKGDSYIESNWYQNEMWSWYYVTKEGKLGIDALDEILLCWGGNTALLILVGMFLVYAMFFSGIMLARRQLEMLLMFFFTPLIFACSICNKQRRQSLYEQLSSLVLQAAAIMVVLGIGATLISKINTLNFGSGLEGLLIKTFFICGVATLILTGSQSVNKFIGQNVSANAGREAIQSMMGFNQAIKGSAVSGALAGAGALYSAGKIARHPVASAKGVGSFAKNGVSGIMSGAKATGNKMKSLGTGVAGAGLGALATLSNKTGLGDSVGLGMKAGVMEGASNLYNSKSAEHLKNMKQNRTNMSNLIQAGKSNLTSPTLQKIKSRSSMGRYGYRI